MDKKNRDRILLNLQGFGNLGGLGFGNLGGLGFGNLGGLYPTSVVPP